MNASKENTGIDMNVELTKVNGQKRSVEITAEGDGWSLELEANGGPERVNDALAEFQRELFRTRHIATGEPIPAVRRVG